MSFTGETSIFFALLKKKPAAITKNAGRTMFAISGIEERFMSQGLERRGKAASRARGRNIRA